MKIKVLYDTDKIIKGGRTYIIKKHFQDMFLSPLMLMAVLCWGYVSGMDNALFGIAISFALFYFLGFMYLLFIKPVQSARHWQRLGLTEVTFTFTESGFESESSIGLSKLSWGTINKYWFAPNYLILIYKSGEHSSIPTHDFSPELLLFIESHIKNTRP